jgi:hypothetical protein
MNPRAFLHEDDVVLYAPAEPKAAHAAVLQLWDRAKVIIAARGPDWTDADGEVHPRQYRLTFAEEREEVTVKQHRFYRGPVLKQISEQAPGGWTELAWHGAFKRQILGYETVREQVAGRKRLTVYQRLRSTSDLSVRQMSDYIDEVIATANTDLGVVFVFKPREREAVRWKPTVRKAKAPTQIDQATGPA